LCHSVENKIVENTPPLKSANKSPKVSGKPCVKYNFAVGVSGEIYAYREYSKNSQKIPISATPPSAIISREIKDVCWGVIYEEA
jgi:hypothetical protein